MSGRTLGLDLRSPEFSDGFPIPVDFTADGRNDSPPLRWADPPPGTKSFALIVDDPDAPRGTFTHWVLFNLPPETRELREGASRSALPAGALEGTNDFGKPGYGGPAPPPGAPHRYYFKLSALSVELKLPAGAKRQDVLKAMDGHVLGEGWLMGTYGRKAK